MAEAVGSGEAPVGLVAKAAGGGGTLVGLTVGLAPWVGSTPLLLLDLQNSLEVSHNGGER